MKKRFFLSPPHLSGEEIELVRKAFESNYVAPTGPMVDAFEADFADYIGSKHTVALASGTAAMHLALRYLKIFQGDFVFVSTLTFMGSVSPIIFEGSIPVFLDADRETWNMDPILLGSELDRCKKINQLPKAVIPTDLYGQCCNLKKIVDICTPFNVPVICDSAEAVGSKYQIADEIEGPSGKNTQWFHAGKGAAAAIYSFNGNKIITTSGGGMLASDNKDLVEYARFLSQQARDPFPHYEHTEIGYNYRMSNILAAIGRGQLKVLDARVNRKRETFDFYKGALGDLPGIEFMPEPSWSRSNRWLTVILVTPELFGVDREKIRLALEAENIESRPVWKPMHLQPVFEVDDPSVEKRKHVQGGKKRYKARVVGGEVAEDLFNRGLCLPSGTAMIEEDLDRVCRVIRSCFKG